MLLIALRDLQYRRRRFVVSVAAVALVFALTLILAGVAASFGAEIDRTLDDFDADAWVMAEGATGPLLGSTPIPFAAVDEIAAAPGVEEVGAVAFRTFTIDDADKTAANVFGVDMGRVGSPEPKQGRRPETTGEALVDTRLGVEIGEAFSMGGEKFVVTGTLSRSTLLAGGPNIFIDVDDMQRIAFGGAPIITTIAVRGTPDELPDGFVLADNAEAHADLARPLHDATGTITMVSVLLWIVAGAIIGSIVYLSALERVGDFAVFKATGMSTWWVLFGLIFQAVVLSLVAAIVAIGLALLLLPILPIPAELPRRIVIFMPVTAVLVAAAASLIGVRSAVKVDPALAFS